MATNTNTNGREGKSNRGFASMAPERQREIASLGGRAAHRDGTAHEFTSEEARAAGRKGGEARALRSAQRREQTLAMAADTGRRAEEPQAPSA
jgi:general stress protein YciG